MFEEMTEQQAREQILEMTRNYCEKYHNKKKPYQKGDRIPYASRVYDAEEMVNLVDSSLEFWLTAGRYTDEFEPVELYVKSAMPDNESVRLYEVKEEDGKLYFLFARNFLTDCDFLLRAMDSE